MPIITNRRTQKHKIHIQVRKTCMEFKIKASCRHMNSVRVDYRQNDHLIVGISLVCLEILKCMNTRNGLSTQEFRVEMGE